MNYLLDTCVLSEFTRRQPEAKVIRWLDQMDEETLFISVITLGEIQHGIERLPASGRKTELSSWLNHELIQRFGQRILLIDSATMLRWGSLTAHLENAGKSMSVMDALIAANALQNNLILATRNVTDFKACGVQLANPWE